MGVRVKTTERIVMDETGTHVVQSESQKSSDTTSLLPLLQSVRGTPQEPNPGDVSTDLLEPMLIIPRMPDVEPTPTEPIIVTTEELAMSTSTKWTSKSLVTRRDAQPAKFSAGLPMSGQGHRRVHETT